MEQIKKPETKKAIFLLTVILIFTLFLTTNIKAGAPAGPTFTSNPVDNPDPVDEGNDVTFTATATDGNDDDWWLAICKTDAITEADPPTCPGGAYCISSSAVLTDTENNCAWTSTSSGAWYGFACDTPLDGCSASVAGDITVNAAPDTTNPDITIVYPSNNSNHSNVNLNVNFTRSDTNLQACWYSNDTYLVNKTLPSCGNLTNVVWSQGKHNVTIWANDTNGNINNSKISFTIDTIKPYFTTIPAAQSVEYSQRTTGVDFDATDDDVEFDSYVVNDSRFQINSSGWFNDTTILEVGNYYINVTINDSLNNLNSTIYNVNITQNTSLALGLTGTTPIEYPATTDFVGSDCPSELTCTLNLTNTIFGAGIRTANYSTVGNNNYSAASATFTVTINQNTSSCDIYFNETSPLEYPASFMVLTNCTTPFTMYRNGTATSNGSTQILSAGSNYNFTIFRDDNANYTNIINNATFTINKNTSLVLGLSASTPITYGDNTNFAGSDCPSELSCSLNITNGIFSAGTISANYSTEGNNNYSARSATFTVTINQGTPTGSLTNSLTTWTINETQEVVIGLSQTNAGDDDLTYIVYRDGVSKTTGETWSPAFGTYEYILNTTGGTNWTANANMDTQTLTVLDNINPNIEIVYPSNNSNHSNSNLDVNFTRSDTNLFNCWYSNDTYSANSTPDSDCGNITTVVWAEGQHNVTIWANDTSGNINNSKISFTIDTTPPYFTTFADQTITEEQSLNYDINANDNGVGLESFSINWTTQFNITISDGILRNSSGLSIGNYYINVSINDTLGNLNSSVLLIQVTTGDAVAPNITTLTETPTDPGEYSPGKTYQFNATIQDTGTISSVLLEFNGTNYTASTIGGDVYNVTLVDLPSSQGVAFNYRWFANDVNGNANNSETGSYTISENSSLTLGLTGTTPIEYPSITDFTSSGCPSQLTCTQNISNQIYSAGTISSNYSTPGNANYSATSTTFTVTINKNSSLVLGLAGTTPIEYPATTDFAGSACPSELSCSLNISNIIYSAGTISANYSTSGNNNYSSSSATFTVTINKNSSLVLGIFGTTPITYGTITNVAGSNCPSELSCSLDNANAVYGVDVSPVTFNYSTAGNNNYTASSITKAITINKAVPEASLTTNLTWTINETRSLTIGLAESNINDSDVTYVVYRDNISKGTGESWTPAFGTYVYILNTTGGANWTVNASMDIATLTVNDDINPNINITYPTNNTNWSNTNLDVNFTRSDTNLGSCWYSNDTYSVNSTPDATCNNITSVVWSEGKHNVTIWSNDSGGNENYSRISFTIDTIPPDISITFPSNNTNTTNVNLDVNYTRGSDTQSCWYSNDTYLINTSLASCGNLTSIIWSEGQHNVTIWANDTVDNENSSRIRFRIDTTPPYFTTFADQTSPETNSLNYDINADDDGVGIESFVINWTTQFNITASDGILRNSSGLLIGEYYINVSVNDTLGNLNSSILLINITPVDNTPPYFDEIPQNQTIEYNTALSYDINATDETAFDTFAVNDSRFKISSSGLLENNTILNVSIHYLNITINDTSSNLNSSIIFVNVTKATPSLSLTIIPSTSVTYGTETTATGSDCPSQLTCKLYRDGIEVTPPETIILGVAIYNYTYNTTGNANYSSASTSDLLTITKNTSIVYTYLNHSKSNITINQGDSIWLNGTLEVGQGDIQLYYNETKINEGTSQLSNNTLFNVIGTHNITTIYSGNENYTSTYETWWVKVADTINPDISITFPSNNTNWSNTNLNVNYTVSDNQAVDSCWYSNDTYLANTTLTSCANITTVTWSEGQHNVTIWANDSSGNINNSKISFTIDSIPPSFTKIKNLAIHNGSSLNYDIDASDTTSNVDCFAINDTSEFEINCSGWLKNATSTESSLGKYYINITVNDTLNNIASEVISISVVQINKTEFMGDSTNFSDVEDLSNISDMVIDHPNSGRINFSESVNLENGTDLDTYINISFNRIEINSTESPNLNKSATLYLYNLTFSTPQILRDDIVCPSTICTQNSYVGGTLSFNVTHFTVYSTEEAPSTLVTPPTSGGGGGITTIYECTEDSDCEVEDEVCWNNKCVKLFDIKIIDFESPIELGEFFDFTYFLKGMADINDDVEINFWIEKGGEVVTSGSDIMYFGDFEEKTETTKIFLPSSIESGIYTFFIQVNYGAYKATSHRVIEIEVKEGIATIDIIEKDSKRYIIFALIILFALILFFRSYLRKNFTNLYGTIRTPLLKVIYNAKILLLEKKKKKMQKEMYKKESAEQLVKEIKEDIKKKPIFQRIKLAKVKEMKIIKEFKSKSRTPSRIKIIKSKPSPVKKPKQIFRPIFKPIKKGKSYLKIPVKKQLQQIKTTAQLIEKIDADAETKKQERTNLIKEKLRKANMFKKRAKPVQESQNITQDNLKAIEELFGEKHKEDIPKEKVPKEKIKFKTEKENPNKIIDRFFKDAEKGKRNYRGEKSKEELDKILDKLEKKK